MTTATATIPEVRAAATPGIPRWSTLYRIGGAAALLCVIFLPVQIAVFIVNPPPATILGWFQLLQTRPLVGLLDLDLLLVADQILTILMFLALYIVLRRFSQSLILVAVALGLLSTVLFIASNPAFAMFSLGDGYAAAQTEVQRAAFLAAGQAIMANWQGSAFQVSYIIGSIAAVVISAVMLRSHVFSKAAAYFGIFSNTLALALYVPRIGTYISVFSVVFLWVWYLLVAHKLFQLAHSGD